MAEIGLFQYKFILQKYGKNGPNNDFLEPKMVLDLVFGGFEGDYHMSLVPSFLRR